MRTSTVTGLTDMMLHQTPTADSPEARWILLNNGTGSLYYAADFVHLNPILADFNGDGRTDQFWGSTAYYSAGDGAFPTGPTPVGVELGGAGGGRFRRRWLRGYLGARRRERHRLLLQS